MAFLFIVKDYMKNGHCIEDQNMLSPISVTSGYKSDTSYEQREWMSIILLHLCEQTIISD